MAAALRFLLNMEFIHFWMLVCERVHYIFVNVFMFSGNGITRVQMVVDEACQVVNFTVSLLLILMLWAKCCRVNLDMVMYGGSMTSADWWSSQLVMAPGGLMAVVWAADIASVIMEGWGIGGYGKHSRRESVSRTRGFVPPEPSNMLPWAMFSINFHEPKEELER